MVQKYPGLILKNRCFYFRLGLPRRHWILARCKEIGYSLNTSNFNVAIGRWRTELAHLQKFINVFESIVMKINENNKVILNETDIDKILLYRLGQIQHFLEENAPDIEDGKKKFKDIQLGILNKKAKVEHLMAKVIVGYLQKLVDTGQANVTLRTVYSKLRDKEVELGLQEKNEDGDQWFKSFNTHMIALEKYASHAITNMKKERTYSPSNPKVKTLLRTYDAVKTNERMTRSLTSTPWEKFFKKYARNKKNLKSTTDNRLFDNFLAIKLCFTLMEKDYIEDITKLDCRKLCERIYRVPKRWNTKSNKDKDVLKILTSNPKKVLSKKTIKNNLITFKEFMRFAVKEDIINNSLNDFVDMPVKLTQNEREPFTPNELRKIFNPETYPDPHSRKAQAKFWVPLIALYQGCRLNEICQLDIDDIVQDRGIACISINNNKPDKSVKNPGSIRTIPIHPKLIEMGLLHFIHYQRLHHVHKLFEGLVQKSIRSGYGSSVQKWFSRYLENISVKSPSKVFHSFRHTFETKAIERKLATEYQNALGGWVDSGIGQKVYGKKKSTKALLEELSKITYPINKELRELTNKVKGSYFYN